MPADLAPEAIERICEILRSGRITPDPVPVRATLDRYHAWQRTRKTHKSFETDHGYLEAFFRAAALEDLRGVTPEVVHRYLAARAAAGRKPKTLNRTREVLHALFEWAIELDLVDWNPLSKVRRAPEPAPSIRYLTLPQLDELLEAVAGDAFLPPIVATLALAGLRRGELVWLRWEDVDLERKLLCVRAKADGSWQPKTKRNRVVPISSRLLPILAGLERRSPWVFTSPHGTRWNGDNLFHRYRERARAAGLPWTLLDLRHTFGTHLVMRGVSLAKVSALMGNSPDICRRHYAHVATEDLRLEVEF